MNSRIRIFPQSQLISGATYRRSDGHYCSTARHPDDNDGLGKHQQNVRRRRLLSFVCYFCLQYYKHISASAAAAFACLLHIVDQREREIYTETLYVLGIFSLPLLIPSRSWKWIWRVNEYYIWWHYYVVASFWVMDSDGTLNGRYWRQWVQVLQLYVKLTMYY